MDHDSLLPDNIVDSNGYNCVERPVQELLTYVPSIYSFSIRKPTSASPFGRLNYVVNNDAIFVFDTIFGTVKKIVPKESDKVSRIHAYIGFSSNQGFLLYRVCGIPRDRHQFITMISIDFENQTYELTGLPYHFPFYYLDYCKFLPIHQLLMIYAGSAPPQMNSLIYLLRVNLESSTIELCQAVSTAHQACLFNLIDDKIIFTYVAIQYTYDGCLLNNFKLVGKDNVSTEIQNTGVFIKETKIDSNDPRVTNLEHHAVFQHCWHEQKAYLFYSRQYSKQLNYRYYPIWACPYIFVFDFEIKSWSEVKLNLPTDRSHYQFHIDNDSMLHVTTFAKVDDNFEGSMKLRSSLIRIPLKKPDALLNLCWFQMRDSGFKDKKVTELMQSQFES